MLGRYETHLQNVCLHKVCFIFYQGCHEAEPQFCLSVNLPFDYRGRQAVKAPVESKSKTLLQLQLHEPILYLQQSILISRAQNHKQEKYISALVILL